MRDGACAPGSSAFSEVQVYSRTDDGVHWTPGRQSAIAATNFDAADGRTDESVFNDKEMIAIDNNPASPHYGRLYVT